MVKLSTLINTRPEDLVLTAKRKVFLFKERNFRFRRFSKHQKQGVNLVGFIRAEIGLGQAARGIARALEAADIPFNVINLDWHKGRNGDLSWVQKEVVASDYDVTVVVATPESMFTIRERLPNSIFQHRFVVGFWFWELPNVPAEWLEAYSLINEVWAASCFTETVVAKNCPVPVTRIPLVVQLKRGNIFPRRHFNLPENAFLFLTMCDTGSVFERKNPLGAIEAFKKAFSADDPNVALIVKITGPPTRPPNWELIQTHIRGYKNIHLIDRLLTPEEVSSLLLATDCFVSLHRSEGFGLLPAESMSLGKPVIVTNWSGNIDYMTSENSVGIDYKLVELDQDYGPYEAGQYWAEPDVAQAADWMKKLSADRDLSHRIGKFGQQTINTEYSPEAIGKIIRARLECIREQYS